MKLDLSGLGVEFTKPQALVSQASIVLYGMPGSGKTTLAASAVEVPELAPVLILDFENSTAAVAEKYGEHPDIDVIQIRTWAQAVKVLDRILTTEHQYKTVVIDPVNGMIQLLQLEMRNRVARKIELGEKARRTPAEEAEFKALSKVNVPDRSNNSMGEPGTTEADYGVIGNEVTSLMARLNSAPFLAILNTHADNYSSRTQTREILRPDMPGNVGRKVMTQKPHVVGFMDSQTAMVDGKVREAFRIQFRPGKVGSLPFEAKGRVGLRDEIINPTMSDLWEAMNSNSTDNE
jgi:hypothetical protein